MFSECFEGDQQNEAGYKKIYGNWNDYKQVKFMSCELPDSNTVLQYVMVNHKANFMSEIRDCLKTSLMLRSELNQINFYFR